MFASFSGSVKTAILEQDWVFSFRKKLPLMYMYLLILFCSILYVPVGMHMDACITQSSRAFLMTVILRF